ncbi:transposase [Nguyenibacter vanlangensis]
MTHDDFGNDGFEPDISTTTGIIDSHMTGRNDGHMTSSYGAGPREEIEIRRRVIRRRRWSDQEKVRILEEAFAPGASRRAVAEQYGIAQAQLYIWRKQLMMFPAAEGFMPVHVGGLAMTARQPGASSPVAAVEIVLPNGISIRTGTTFDPDAVCRLVLGLGRP